MKRDPLRSESRGNPDPQPWVVVLAGGDGLRLKSLTRDEHGRHVPKQFCSFTGDGALLDHTLDRAAGLTSADRILVVVQEAHRRWWGPLLRRLPPDNVIVQAANRGTGVAVLRAVRRVRGRERNPFFLFLPSDQGVEHEAAWRGAIRRAGRSARRWPFHVVLIAMAVQLDPDFGWLLPGQESPDETRPVLEFIEKPTHAEAVRVVARGGLCSTFVFAASAEALLALYRLHAPDLLARLAREADGLGGPRSQGRTSLEVPPCDFSRDLLAYAAERVRLLPGPACGWTDLGTPERLESWRERRVGLRVRAS
jgi:mannose-1-phosphate guanylyltransferase